jgi:hypothetical protein
VLQNQDLNALVVAASEGVAAVDSELVGAASAAILLNIITK